MTDRKILIKLQKTNCKKNKPCVNDCLECMADHLIANGVTIPVRCDECKLYEEPDEGDYLGVCRAGILAVSNNGEIYPGRGFYCLYGERKDNVL